MNSVAVMNLNTASQGTASVKTFSGTEKKSNDFQNVMSQASDNEEFFKKNNLQEENQKAEQVGQESDTSQSDVTQTSNDSESNQSKISETDEIDETDDKTDQMSDDVLSAMAQIGQKMITTIAEALNVNEAEVEDMMQEMNLQSTDLLQAGNVKNLVLALEGDQEGTSLLTDENLFTTVNSLFSTLQDFKTQLESELGLSEEQIQQIVKNLADVQETGEAEIPELVTQNSSETDLKTTMDYMQNQMLSNSNELESLAEDVSKDNASDEQKISGEIAKEISKADIQQSDTRNQILSKDVSEIVEDVSKSEQQSFSDSQSQMSGQSNSFLQHLLQNNIQTDNVLSQESESTFVMPDTQKIMDQIAEYMKVSVKSDVSQLEMQLHPENLGKLTIQLTSKEGVMTAQFTAQNEDVKAALQSQILVLKQNLEAQGLTVGAVEVTVANYEQQGDGGFSNQDDSGKQKSDGKRRRINLNLLTDDMEDLEDSELLSAQIMKDNGNSVDYMA